MSASLRCGQGAVVRRSRLPGVEVQLVWSTVQEHASSNGMSQQFFIVGNSHNSLKGALNANILGKQGTRVLSSISGPACRPFFLR